MNSNEKRLIYDALVFFVEAAKSGLTIGTISSEKCLYRYTVDSEGDFEDWESIPESFQFKMNE